VAEASDSRDVGSCCCSYHVGCIVSRQGSKGTYPELFPDTVQSVCNVLGSVPVLQLSRSQNLQHSQREKMDQMDGQACALWSGSAHTFI